MTDTLEFKWTVSRGRDTYGYNICSLYVRGDKVARCNGGGYDMRGTCLGNFIAAKYADRLNALKPKDMPKQSHWERAEKPRRICENLECRVTNAKIEETGKSYYLPPDAEKCPHCGGDTRVDWNDGKTVDDGRYFYGLTYHDPNYDPGKAVVGRDCADRTFGKDAEGVTVEEAEKAGQSLGLERYQAFYRASSKVPTKRHTVPLIDGATGFSSVERIMEAIGLRLEYVPTKGKNSIYVLHDNYKRAAA